MISGELQMPVEILDIIYHHPESRWLVCKAREENTTTPFTVTGYLHSAQTGEYFIAVGSWNRHKRFGLQFQASRLIAARPQTEIGILRYLASPLFPGIGEKTARKIVSTLGLNSLQCIEENPQKLYKVPGIGKKRTSQILAIWKRHSCRTKSLMFLHKHNLTGRLCEKIVELYKEETVKKICDNPYALVKKIRGVGFLTADRIASSVGFALDHPYRIKQGILHTLEVASDRGHCFLDWKQLKSETTAALHLEPENTEDLLKEACQKLLENYEIFIDEQDDSKKITKYYLPKLYLAELNIATHVNRLKKEEISTQEHEKQLLKDRVCDWLKRYCKKSDFLLADEQKNAVVGSAVEKIFLLTGGPGVGKTTVANIIIKLFKAMGKKIALAAPTGRAAQRLKEISSSETKTIHRLLEWSPNEQCFKRHQDNPICADVLMIDECSMLDVYLAEQLFRAVPTSCQVILIGDVDQLPSVGPGQIFRDLLETKNLPKVSLKTVYRQSAESKIITHAHAINEGRIPLFEDKHDKNDCHFIETKDDEQIIPIIKELLANTLPQAGYRIKKDVQILTPMNQGPLGCLSLNEKFQNILNPTEDKKKAVVCKNYSIYPGDKVIQLVNNYDLNVFNGDIGEVVHTHSANSLLIVAYGQRLVHYSEEQTSEVSLAYSITIHKSQGSEFSVVIIPLTMGHYVMLQRNLIYTALTRARQLAVFVGLKRALKRAVANGTSTQRQTNLRLRLK